MKRIFCALLAAAMLLLPFMALADVILEPEDSFYKRHSDQCTYQAGRTYIASGEGGSAPVYGAPDRGERRRLSNGEETVCQWLYTDGNGAQWALISDGSGWINLYDFKVKYDWVEFEREHKDEIKHEDAEVDAAKGAGDTIIFYDYPGSGRKAFDLSLGAFGSDKITVDTTYTDGEGRRWGFIGYWYGYRNLWISLDDPTVEVPPAAEQPAPVPEPAAEPAQAELVRQAPEPAPAPVPSVPPAPPAAPLSGESPREPEPAKVSREEARQAAQEVARDVQSRLAEAGEHPYQYPPLSLLKEGPGDIGGEALVELNANRQRLDDTIHSFGIDANIVNVTRGPSVTRYELELDQGVRLNKLTNLADDIALALGASGVRIAPIPDQISMVGIEVPNKLVSPVNIHSVIGSREFTDSPSKVSFAVGKDIGGHCIVGNIAKLPHLLIAGTTGSGKSVCTNSLIISLLYKATPDEVRLIMVDPKMVELGIYNGIPHLLIPVVTDPKKAAGALQWAVTEMMKRYRTFAEVGVRDLAAYNALAARTEGMTKMPQIVVVIDELADLMLVAAKEVEESICRVAQMGRASGMHLIIATQRPSADVITGLMKANIPSRIAFAVASSLESRIILDTTGAEKLVGRGDMLYFPLGSGKPTRVQGCLISDQEVAAVVDFVKQNSGDASYDDQVMQEIEQHAAEKEKGAKGVGGSAPEEVGEEFDELIDAAAEVILETGQASVSMLQRRLKLGYARAARLVDQLEEKGIVGPFEGSKPRQLLITKEQWQEMKYRQGVPGGTPPESASGAAPGGAEEDMPPFDVGEALDRAEEDTL